MDDVVRDDLRTTGKSSDLAARTRFLGVGDDLLPGEANAGSAHEPRRLSWSEPLRVARTGIREQRQCVFSVSTIEVGLASRRTLQPLPVVDGMRERVGGASGKRYAGIPATDGVADAIMSIGFASPAVGGNSAATSNSPASVSRRRIPA